jgi:hypothetical protein
MSVIIKSGATSDTLTVDTTSKAARTSLYESGSATALDKTDKLASGWTSTSKGLPVMGVDYKTPRAIRVNSDGSLPAPESLAFLEQVEGATLNTVLWTNTNTTMTVAQAAGLITLNNSAITTTTTGNLLLSNRSFAITSRGKIIFRSRQRHTAHGTNNLIELGFGTTASATAAGIGTGACWRKDGTGQYVPVISVVNGTETLGTPISNATFVAAIPATDYAIFEIEMESSQCTFRILTSLGVLVNEQQIDLTAITGNYQATHVQAMIRLYHAGAAGAATQALIANASVWVMDQLQNKSWPAIQSGYGLNSLASPTAYTQLANWTNSAAPTTRTLANGTAAETTLGGLLVANSIAGGNTDLIMFGFTVPSPYTFYFTGIRISPPLNQVVAVATTATLFIYGMSINNTAPTNLGSGTHFRVGLQGSHNAAIALAANAQFSGNDVVWTPATPMAVAPGRGLTVFCRELVGTATATETYLWSVAIDGWFE